MSETRISGPSRRHVLRAGTGLAAAMLAGGRALAGARVKLGAAEDVFAREGFSGTFVAYEAGSDRLVTLNAARAGVRFVPASTFKIPNSLIALEVGAVKDAGEIFRYDGKPRRMAAWQRDMTLHEAVTASNVPVFQEIARRVGLERYRTWLATLDYGNRATGEVVDRFWLDGPLAISAEEHARFLARLAGQELPMGTRAQDIVRDILRLEERDGRVLFAKTGWDGKIGWWAGWVEQGARKTAFALNMDLARMEDAPKRIAIGKVLLAQLEIY